MRSVEEWIGKTDDAKVPNRVRIRVFERFHGRCYRSGIPIAAGQPWELDHIIALANGGSHRESNLAPILASEHKLKSKQDRKVQTRIFKAKRRHLGLRKAKSKPMPGSKASGWRRKMDGTWERR